MISVYTANTPNGIKIPIALEELGLDYELILLDLNNKDQKTPEFLCLNPNGRIPAIIDDNVAGQDGQVQAVFESGAILLYLAEKYGGLLGETAQERIAALEWLFFQMGGVGPMFGQVNFFKSSEKYPSENAVARFEEESRRLVEVLESRLQKSSWLAGEHYSIADIANYGWLRFGESVGIELTRYPAILRWRQKIEIRPAVEQGVRRVKNPDKFFSSIDVPIAC